MALPSIESDLRSWSREVLEGHGREDGGAQRGQVAQLVVLQV